MTLLKQFWTADAEPEGKTVSQLLYEIRKDDADGQIYDAVDKSDLEAFAGEFLEDAMFDALITPYSKLERKMNIMLSVMKTAAQEVKPTGVLISKPFKKYNSVQVGVVFTLSDEQTITVFFHNPDTTPTKLAPTDDLVSWKWMLNKKDVTIIVAPEHGKDLNVREVARRLMKIAEKNSAAFLRQNANLKARKEQIEKDAKEVEELEKQLAEILDEIKFLTEDNAQRRENIKVLTEKVEAEKAAQEKAEQERLAAEKAAAEKAAAEKAEAEKKAAEEKAKAEEDAKKAAEEEAKKAEEATEKPEYPKYAVLACDLIEETTKKVDPNIEEYFGITYGGSFESYLKENGFAEDGGIGKFEITQKFIDLYKEKGASGFPPFTTRYDNSEGHTLAEVKQYKNLWIDAVADHFGITSDKQKKTPAPEPAKDEPKENPDAQFLKGIIDGSIDANEQENMDRLEKIAEAHDSESDPLMPLLNEALNTLATQTVGKATSVLAA